MAAPAKKSLTSPDEHVEGPGVEADAVALGDSIVSRNVFQPGAHCPEISQMGNRLCMAHHTGVVLDGSLHIEMQDGSVIDLGPDEVFDIPPGHDGWAVGDRPWTAVTWAGFRSWTTDRSGERILVTLLFTDIVGSTERAAAIGDSGWREVLAGHYRVVREILDRFHGREVKTAGDGFLAVFDGAVRAIKAAVTIRDRSERDGLSVRAGVHSGEVEVHGDDLHGLTVHEAARIASAAGPGEILVSEATRLHAGSSVFRFESRGPFDLKGLPGQRILFAVEEPLADRDTT
jgi:class 3 adenylate cyclase